MDKSLTHVADEQLRAAPLQTLKWLIEIAEAGLAGPWKDDDKAPLVRMVLKRMKAELARRKGHDTLVQILAPSKAKKRRV